MKTANKSLLTLTARELMTTEVIAVPHEMSLQGAARLLARSAVSGAPVVDAEGRCVGVLSATDFLLWAQKHDSPSQCFNPGCMVSAWQMMEADKLPEDAVSRFMTPDPVTVAPGTRIGELARMMRDAHIHRLIVVDADRRPVGVVSSLDLLAALAEAAQKPAYAEN
jgi:CBS domain-containing protein